MDVSKDSSEGQSVGAHMVRIRNYAQMYALLGIFETRLRITIPNVLGAEQGRQIENYAKIWRT